jgi:hypothetical protein
MMLERALDDAPIQRAGGLREMRESGFKGAWACTKS